jgi:hypothetical protein
MDAAADATVQSMPVSSGLSDGYGFLIASTTFDGPEA